MHRLLKTTFEREYLSWFFIVSLIFGVLISGSAFGELSDKEISALEERAEIESWSFSVGKNSATDYSLEDICGLKIPDNWPDKANFKTLKDRKSVV